MAVHHDVLAGQGAGVRRPDPPVRVSDRTVRREGGRHGRRAGPRLGRPSPTDLKTCCEETTMLHATLDETEGRGEESELA